MNLPFSNFWHMKMIHYKIFKLVAKTIFTSIFSHLTYSPLFDHYQIKEKIVF